MKKLKIFAVVFAVCVTFTVPAFAAYSSNFLKLSNVALTENGKNNDGDFSYSLSVSASTNAAAIDHISVQFKNNADDSTKNVLLYPEDFNGENYITDFTISAYAFQGVYHLEKIVIVDTEDEYMTYRTSADYDESNEHQRKLTNSIAFKFNSGVSRKDTTAPKVSAISLSAAEIEAESKLTVFADVSDDISGVDYIKLRFIGDNGRAISVELEQNDDGSYSKSIPTAATKHPGVYTLSRVMVKDNAGNRAVLSLANSSIISDIYFTVS